MSKKTVFFVAFLLMFSLFLSATGTLPVSAAVLPDNLASSFRFASIGDSQAEPERFSTTLNQISTLNPAFVIFNGDLENDGVNSHEMDPMIDALKDANLFRNTFLVRGNHDDEVSGSAALWEKYFETAPNTRVLPDGVTNYVSLNSNSDYLSYSFNYGNSIFIGLDDPGNVNSLTTTLLNFLDSRLTYAEGQGLTHAFIFFHGPAYCVTSIHCSCSSRTDASCTPSAWVSVINKHPIVSATFHGHEHVLGWTHMDNTRVAGLTGSYEQFMTSPAGGWTYNKYLYPNRMDYTYLDMGSSSLGFATIDVNGNSFTVSIYKVGTTQPVWSKTSYKPTTSTSTGFQAPTANKAVTTNAGDKNGYERKAMNAYAADNKFAVDLNSGTGASTSYINNGKDKHLFYNYKFNIPTGAVIKGIQVRLDTRADATSGFPKIYVQLSWNGGATWTTAKATAKLKTTETTYTLGGTANTWGRTWRTANFSNANFRVRVIDVASNTSRDFYLDYIAVNVTYQP